MTGPAGAPGTDPTLAGRPGLVTPDAVALDLELATIGSRGVAYVVDLAILATGLVVLAIAEATFGFGGFVPGWAAIALTLLLVFALTFGYPILWETLTRGRTPGKYALGLRVVTEEGAPIGVRHAAIRATLGVVELLGTLGGVAVLVSFASARSQRLGDLVAGTLVVRERRGSARPPTVETFAAPVGAEGYVAVLDVSRLRPQDYALVRDTLRRAAELAPARQAALAGALAADLAARVQPSPPAGMPAPVFLACVAAAVQHSRRVTSGPAVPAVPGGSGLPGSRMSPGAAQRTRWSAPSGSPTNPVAGGAPTPAAVHPPAPPSAWASGGQQGFAPPA